MFTSAYTHTEIHTGKAHMMHCADWRRKDGICMLYYLCFMFLYCSKLHCHLTSLCLSANPNPHLQGPAAVVCLNNKPVPSSSAPEAVAGPLPPYPSTLLSSSRNRLDLSAGCQVSNHTSESSYPSCLMSHFSHLLLLYSYRRR